MLHLWQSLRARVGRRPLPWFVGLWLLLTLVWLLGGLLHYRVARQDLSAPPPEAIPYAKFLLSPSDLPLDPDRLPAFDAELRQRNTYFRIYETETGDARLVCLVNSERGRCGWPKPWVRWMGGPAYDVTDPTRPFDRPERLPDFRHLTWDRGYLSWSLMSRADRSWSMGHWEWKPMLLRALVIEAVAAACILGIWGFSGLSRRRRLRLGLCIRCGYDLRASAGQAICPECGNAQPSSRTEERQTPQRIRAGRMFLLFWVLLVAAWLAASALGVEDRGLPNPAERLEQIAARAQESATSLAGAPYVANKMVAHRSHGWPIPFVSVWHLQRYLCEPGEQPVAVVNRRFTPGIRNGGDYVQWARRTQDPTLNQFVEFSWSPALVQVAGLQLPSLALVGIVAVGAGLWRRRAAASQDRA